jgi:hypothetical protein
MSNTDYGASLGRETLDSLGWHPTLEEALQGLLLMAIDNNTPGAFRYAAFEALVETFRETAKPKNERPQLQDPVEVPWWVIDVLVGGWQKYREDPKSKLGVALELENTGGRRVLTKLDQFHRDLMLAFEVFHLVETTKNTSNPLSVEMAVFEVSERHTDPKNPEKALVSTDRLQKIYYQHRKTVMAAYSRKARPS